MLVSWDIFFYIFMALSLASCTIKVKGQKHFKIDRWIEDIIKDTTSEWYSKAINPRNSGLKDSDSKDSTIFKRTENETYELLLMMNESGVHWDLLDMLADNPRVRRSIVNVTGGFIKGAGVSDKDTNGNFERLNLTDLGYHIWDSGLAISITDGLLLDESYRPTIAHLIERIVLSYKEDIYHFVHNLHHIRLKKRYPTASLSKFILASLSSLTSSNRAVDTRELCVALNQTQMGVYTIKKFLANEKYNNLTIELVNDLIDTGALDANLKSIDISRQMSSIMSSPSKSIMPSINRVIRNLRDSPNSIADLKKFSDRYSRAVKDIVQIMEDDGFFNELNNHIFSNSFGRVTKQLSTTTTARFIANKYRSSDASYQIRPMSSLFDYILIYFQLIAVTSASLLL